MNAEIALREAEISEMRSRLQVLLDMGGAAVMAQVVDLTWAIRDSQQRLCLLRILSIKSYVSAFYPDSSNITNTSTKYHGPSSSSFEDIHSYIEKKQKSALGVSLTAHFVALARGENNLMGLNDFNPDHCAAMSRRVLLTGLPGSATVAQVARGVAGLGGVLNVFVHPDLRAGTVPGQLVAVVEFGTPLDAAQYVQFVHVQGIWFEDIERIHHQAYAKYILTPSNEITTIHPQNYGVANNGLSGRCIQLEDFPVAAIWSLFRDFGVRHIVDATITTDDDDFPYGYLTIEFASLFEAARCSSYLIRGYFRPYRPFAHMVTLAWSRCDRDVQELEVDENGLIRHVELDHIEREWNVEPYNTIPSTQFGKRLTWSASKNQRPLASRYGVTVLGDNGMRRRVPPEQVTTTMSTDETNYILINDCIFARAVVEPFDLYYRVHSQELARIKQFQGIDIRGYYAYAQIAAFRREFNRLHGLHYSDSGEMLEQTDIPDYILSYSQPHLVRKIVSTNV
ncbi:hypothetical protein FSPOR_2008 [Fusarium sporotrichioides]|uniref:RRM domain-containing protein n=1 Tax=Fusarium sporotrichioides TaxID=5514 RepID=A0A395SM08_FUSSP|nr:hypothetical protein FSPOR_2008 [Fusarium sporotrichioides]